MFMFFLGRSLLPNKLEDHWLPNKDDKDVHVLPTASWQYVYRFFEKHSWPFFPGKWRNLLSLMMKTQVFLIRNRFLEGIFWYVLFDVLTKTWTSRIIITAKCCRAGFSPVLDCNNRMVGWRLYGLRMDVQRFSVGPGRISGDKVRSEQILNTLPWVYFQLVMLWYLIVILALSWQGFS